MSFIPGEDAEVLRTVVRDFMEKRSPAEDVRDLAETDAGYHTGVWAQAAEEIGLHGLTIPERYGGSAASVVELGVAFEEMGAALYSGPFFATVGLAATALQEACEESAAATYLPGIVDGSTVATLAWSGRNPAHSEVTALSGDDGWTLSGTCPIVVDGAAADLILVAARSGAGTGLFAVDGNASGLRRTPLTTLDSTRRLAELRFDSTPATLVSAQAAEAPLCRAFDLATLYLAAEQLGGAASVLSTAVEYASTRVQFGRAIGSFQTIKHRLADMLIDVESSRSVVYHGLWTAKHEPHNLPVAASLARALVSDAYQRVAADNIQIHGGVGFTWEHCAHLYLKRAKSSQLLLGRPSAHRRRLAGLLGIDPGTGLATSTSADMPSPRETPEATEVREAVEEFLREHPVPGEGDPMGDRDFRAARFAAGLAYGHFAEGHGGRGLDSSLQPVIDEGFAAAGAADHTARNVIALGMALPTIHAHGTEEQKQRFLRPGFTGEEVWCQLFSEPGAGSDLAALATRAVRDGDDFIVNGQKIWTSLGHVAQWAILLARTDPDVPKHKGLSYFLLDMSTPGVEVRPLRQLTGETEFNEVYLTDVRVPAANVLGEVGDGWRVAMTTLANERVSLGGRVAVRGEGPIGQAVEQYRSCAPGGDVDAAVTERLMVLWCRAEAARLTNLRAAAQTGREPGPEGSIAKLQMAELNKAVYELCVDLSGNAGLLIDGYQETAPDFAAVHGGADVRKAYLRSLANSIEGGTSEVMRTILGERVLGLPGEPRVDRDVPWKQLRRS